MTPPMLFQINVEDLRAIIRDELARTADNDSDDGATFMSAKDVAKLLGCTTRTITNYVKTESLPHYHTGRMLRFKREEIEAWIAQRRGTR